MSKFKCGECGCSITAEIKKGRYIYYHCTFDKGKCGGSYVREEELERQFGEIFKRSEEHTSELQSHSFISYAVFCLKKKKNSK